MSKSLSTSRPPGKYWRQRYDLIANWEDGVLFDNEAWFSVTPQVIAECQAHAFCGAGGNTLAFAKIGCHVIACDVDSDKLKMARHNVQLAGLDKFVDFVCGDYTEVACMLRADCIFLSPPWGGPKYSQNETFQLERGLAGALCTTEIVNRALLATPCTVCFLPHNANVDVLLSQSIAKNVTLEENYCKSSKKAVTLYFGSQSMLPQQKF